MPSPLGTLALRWLDKLVLQGVRVYLDEQTQRSLSCRIPTIRRAEAPYLKNGQHHRIIGNETIAHLVTTGQLISVLDQCLPYEIGIVKGGMHLVDVA